MSLHSLVGNLEVLGKGPVKFCFWYHTVLPLFKNINRPRNLACKQIISWLSYCCCGTSLRSLLNDAHNNIEVINLINICLGVVQFVNGVGVVVKDGASTMLIISLVQSGVCYYY